MVGAGPAGLMTALTLAEADYRPLLIERGIQTETRHAQVETFSRQALLDSESNVLFGEGEAGLFSDGKLTARSKDRASIRHFIETLVAYGASPDILIDAEPHIGSDVLAEVIPALRQRIVDAGGEVQCQTQEHPDRGWHVTWYCHLRNRTPDGCVLPHHWAQCPRYLPPVGRERRAAGSQTICHRRTIGITAAKDRLGSIRTLVTGLSNWTCELPLDIEG